MKTTGKSQRIKPKYLNKVKVAEKYRPFLWDYPDSRPSLETYLVRILTYGDFEDIKSLCKKNPMETLDIAFRYPEIKRGVKFWVNRLTNGT